MEKTTELPLNIEPPWRFDRYDLDYEDSILSTFATPRSVIAFYTLFMIAIAIAISWVLYVI